MLKISIICLGNKMPDWVNNGVKDYLKRFREGIQIKIIEIPLIQRTKSCNLMRILEKESTLIMNSIPPDAYFIALDMQGQSFTSKELAVKLVRLQHINSHLCFVIGGPEGLSKIVIDKSQEQWSLSKLTLPHPLVRIVLVETLYRTWAIINNHPYHK